MTDDPNKIRITLDEVEKVTLSSPPVPSPAMPSSQRNWGNVQGGQSAYAPPVSQSANFFLKTWVYLGVAGLVGAFLGWAICEPTFIDGDSTQNGWGNFWLFPLVITLMCVGFALAEGIVERSAKKTIIRGLLAVILGLVFGWCFDLIANIIYRWGFRHFWSSSQDIDPSAPLFWINRAIAWAVFGIAGGIIYGIVGFSGKKGLYGIIGGMIGAGIGGFLFDPISLLIHGEGPHEGAASRCIGLLFLGVSTGIAMGLVESAFKDRWLYVSAGPLAGKQFILYKPVTRFGRDQANEIYLFKDLSILPQHAVIDLRGGRPILMAQGATLVNGLPVTQCGLRSGDLVQIGRYSFQFQEKQRAG